jgi:tryptophan 2,3-dioxygenase
LRKICIHRSKTETHLEGLLWSKPMTYWDYIQTDALLNIQTKGQHFQMKWFFMYQVNELIFKMILWEMKQISYCENIETVFYRKINEN